MNVNHLILDYYATCEKLGKVLDLGGFVAVWEAATELAEETAPEDREMVLALASFPNPE